MPPIRALVVDDSSAMRRSIVFALQRMGEVVCVEAQDGIEGLKRFVEAQYDIVLTDINMPVMDGLKLISHIRRGSAPNRVPIVVITTESAVEDRTRAMGLGASAYLVKPVQAQQVVEAVRALLRLGGSG
ncbi:MAG: response regulator [Myxococcales bacterium]|nr:response regulator [Myxococcales bacterium]